MPVATSRRERSALTTPAFLPYADGIRVAAILAVVAVHSSGMAVVRYAALPPTQWWVANVVDSGCRWAVPVFVMLSGALMLDPARQQRWTEFYGRRVQRLGVPLVFWTSFYLVWASTFLGEHVTLRWVADKLYQGLTYNHLYFLFLILGLYAVTPVLRMVIGRVGRPAEWGIAAVALGLAACGILQDAIPSNAFTLFVPYVGYYLSGHVLADRPVSRRDVAIAMVAFVGATAVIATGTASRFARWGVDDWRVLALYDYLGPVVMVQSITAFVVLRGVFAHGGLGGTSPFIRQLGLAAFGIYLVHRVPLDVLHRHLGSMLTTSALPVITTEVAVAYAVSAVVVTAMLRIPFVRRTVA